MIYSLLLIPRTHATSPPQSAFIPFLTENIYQGLRPFFPEDVSSLNLGEDIRSLHFLPFPSVRQEYFDPVIQRQVSRLQAVIDLGRTARGPWTDIFDSKGKQVMKDGKPARERALIALKVRLSSPRRFAIC